MTGFEPWSSCIESDRVVNCATTTTQISFFCRLTVRPDGEILIRFDRSTFDIKISTAAKLMNKLAKECVFPLSN